MPRLPFLTMPEVRQHLNNNSDRPAPFAMGPVFYEERPNHLNKIAKCVMLWSSVEHMIAMLLAHLLQTKADAAINVYLTLRRQSARDAAITAAADKTLNSNGIKMLAALLKASSSVEKERNALVHSYWGISVLLPNHLLWISSANLTFSELTYISNPTTPLTDKTFAEKLFCYGVDDLQNIEESMNTILTAFWGFRSYVRSYLEDRDFSEAQSILDQLSSLSPIQQALQTITERDARQNHSRP